MVLSPENESEIYNYRLDVALISHLSLPTSTISDTKVTTVSSDLVLSNIKNGLTMWKLKLSSVSRRVLLNVC